MKKYRVKYLYMSRPNIICFGLFDDSFAWVKWKMKTEEETGEEIEFLRSYLVSTEKESNPLEKEVEKNERGSAYTNFED